MTRKELIRDLITLRRPLSEIRADLDQFPWDADRPLVELAPSSILAVLQRFLDGTVSVSELEEWANMLESRDDIGFEQDSKDVIKDVIFELANPLLSRPISMLSVTRIVGRLRGKQE